MKKAQFQPSASNKSVLLSHEEAYEQGRELLTAMLTYKKEQELQSKRQHLVVA
jgi:hypothetical protein